MHILLSTLYILGAGELSHTPHCVISIFVVSNGVICIDSLGIAASIHSIFRGPPWRTCSVLPFIVSEGEGHKKVA